MSGVWGPEAQVGWRSVNDQHAVCSSDVSWLVVLTHCKLVGKFGDEGC